MKAVFYALPLVLLATGCSKTNDYTPAAGVAGADVFKAVCADCHQADGNGKYFELTADKATTDAIAKKINEGGMMMPGFPNIKGDSMTALSAYVLENSAKK